MKILIFLKIQNLMDINMDLLQWIINLLIKISVSGIRNANISNKESPEELQKPIVKNFKKDKYTQLL